MLPNLYNEIYKKIENNKIFLWIHDLINSNIFLFNYSEEERNLYHDDKNLYKNILTIIYNNKNINFVFVSEFINDKLKIYFNDNNINIEDYRLNVIYNILYENEYLNIKNQKYHSE